MISPNREYIGRRVLFLVENLPSPFDRRVWQEATTLRDNGWQVCIICPTGKGYELIHENIEGVNIYRYHLPREGEAAIGYLSEYSAALWHTIRLTWKVYRIHGIDAIHACNPPDIFFLVAGFYKLLFGTKFLFDHHDINPELYEAKFGRRDLFWKFVVALERWTFRAADVSIATNESYRRIAIERGRMEPDKVFVVRSGPKLDRLQIKPAVPELKRGRTFLVGYVGVMGAQEGIDYLLRAAQYIVHKLERNDVHFGLVGDGTSLAEMEDMARDLRVDDFVTFTGRVPDSELLDMLNTADVCVNPDVANPMNDKSTMNKILEYMALGKPIVQFDLTEGRFSAGAASLYAAPNDAIDLAEKIVTILDDAELRTRMGEFGRLRVINELEWKYEVPKLLKAYETLMTTTTRRRPTFRWPLRALRK